MHVLLQKLREVVLAEQLGEQLDAVILLLVRSFVEFDVLAREVIQRAFIVGGDLVVNRVPIVVAPLAFVAKHAVTGERVGAHIVMHGPYRVPQVPVMAILGIIAFIEMNAYVGGLQAM